MTSYNQTVFKTLIFANDKVMERLQDQSINVREKASVLGEIRTRKINKDIKNYQVSVLEGVNVYKLQLEDGVIAVHMNQKDVANLFLKTILKGSKMARDEVNVIVKQDQFHMRSRNEGIEKTGKDMNHMIDILRGMQNNKEIENVTKTGKQTFTYIFETTENEKIKIMVSKDNTDVVNELDRFVNIYLKKKSIIKKTIAGLAIGISLAVASPYIYQNVHDFKIEQSENRAMDLETKFNLMHSYALRLQSDNLGSEEYDKFRKLIVEVMTFYEEKEKTTSPDYETLQSYQQLVDEYYSTISKGRSY